MDNTRICLQLSKQLLEKIKLEADNRDISVSAYIRYILSEHLFKNEGNK